MAHPVPTDFEDALAAAPAAREAFWALPPAKVDEWVGWIEGARRPRTRRSRIAEAVTRLGGAAPVVAAETTVVETNGAAPVAPRPPRESAGLWLLALAFLLIVAGLIWPWLRRMPLFHLPGDIVIDRPGFKFFFPLTTMLIVSAVISVLSWLLRR